MNYTIDTKLRIVMLHAGAYEACDLGTLIEKYGDRYSYVVGESIDEIPEPEEETEEGKPVGFQVGAGYVPLQAEDEIEIDENK